MFTVLSNTRNSYLYLIAALATATVILLTLAFVPAISAPESVLVPVTGNSERTSDYFQRHPELRVSVVPGAEPASDFYLRHPEWSIAPVAVNSEASDYFQRHPELNDRPGMACESPVDCR